MRRRQLCALALGPWLPGVAAAQGSSTRRITVRARVPETSGTVYLTGNLPELGPWDPAKRAMDGFGAERRLALDVPAGMRLEPKSGSYPVAGSPVGGLNGARVGAILSLT